MYVETSSQLCNKRRTLNKVYVRQFFPFRMAHLVYPKGGFTCVPANVIRYPEVLWQSGNKKGILSNSIRVWIVKMNYDR